MQHDSEALDAMIAYCMDVRRVDDAAAATAAAIEKYTDSST